MHFEVVFVSYFLIDSGPKIFKNVFISFLCKKLARFLGFKFRKRYSGKGKILVVDNVKEANLGTLL